MGGPVAEDSGRDNRAAVAQVQARQRTAEANRLPGTLGAIQGAMGDATRRRITRGLELGGEAVRDERGQVVGVINMNQLGGRVYSGRAGYNPFAPPDTSSDDNNQRQAAPAAAAPVAPPVAPPPATSTPPAGSAPTSSTPAAPPAEPIQPRSVVRSASETAAVTRRRQSPYARGRRTRTVLTSGRGVLGAAPTEKKQLLGGN